MKAYLSKKSWFLKQFRRCKFWTFPLILDSFGTFFGRSDHRAQKLSSSRNVTSFAPKTKNRFQKGHPSPLSHFWKTELGPSFYVRSCVGLPKLLNEENNWWSNCCFEPKLQGCAFFQCSPCWFFFSEGAGGCFDSWQQFGKRNMRLKLESGGVAALKMNSVINYWYANAHFEHLT